MIWVIEWPLSSARWSVHAPPATPAKRPQAARGGVHRLGDRETVVPEMLAEAQGGLPVDEVAAVDRGDVGGGVDAPGRRRRVGARPARRRDLKRRRPARER